MRPRPFSTFALLLPASLLCLAAVIWPLTAGALHLSGSVSEARTTLAQTGLFDWSGVPKLLGYTLAWGAAVALGSALLSLPAAFALAAPDGASSFTRRTILPIGMVGVLCLPPYVLYWVWGLWDWPGSGAGQALAHWIGSDASRAQLICDALLFWSLIFWSWPIPAFTLSLRLRAIPPDRRAMLHLDGAAPLRRALLLLVEARAGLLAGLGLVLLATLTSYDTFDLASVFTYGNVLRRLYFGFGAGSLITALAALPMVLVNLLAAFLFLRFALTPRAHRLDEPDSSSRSPSSASSSPPILALLVLALSLLGPLALMLWRLLSRSGLSALASLPALEGPALLDSLRVALVVGLAFAFLALLAARFRTLDTFATSAERLAGRIFALQSALWIIVGLLPVAALGSFFVLSESALPDSLRALAQGQTGPPVPWTLCLAHLARYAFLALFIGTALADSQPPALSYQRRLDGADSFVPWLAASGPALLTTLLGAFCLGALLSLAEVSATIIVTPPGFQAMSDRLLNKLHYAREDSALALCLLLALVTFTLACVAALLIRHAHRRGRVSP